ncbi:hypothetical protein [Candidatus Palauibacter sp.]|uniref:hypothetical protein n=1 Tax=Candidatus Palauibacter sp. TaxID=3101350 RepID=UPI003B5CC797
MTGTTITTLSATIGSLAENTSYDVQVRATNDEGTGSWSDSGSGRTDANAAPTFSSDATFDAAENQTVAGAVLATDSDAGDDVTGYEITGGADDAFFSIGATDGALTFDAAPNYEDAKDQDTAGNTYVVVVTATSGAGEREKTATQTITVTVTDVDTEAPGKPDAPAVSAASVTSLTVTWTAPANAGPAITDYDYRHRTTSPEGAWTGGDRHDDHDAVGDDREPGREHVLRRAGAGDQRRGHGLVVGLGLGPDGRERGADVQLGCDVRRGGEPDGGRRGAGDGQRRGRRRDGLRDHRRGG